MLPPSYSNINNTDREKLIKLMAVFLDPSCQMQKDVTAKCFVRRWYMAHGLDTENEWRKNSDV